MFLSDSIVQPERFQVVESIQKFEDLLVTNNLFVDYFNAFLLNPVRQIIICEFYSKKKKKL